jgi:hypothetical protein
VTANPQHSDQWLDFFAAGLELVPPIVREPRLDLLRAYFEARFARWPHPYMLGEFFDPGNYDSLIEAMEPQAAFQLIPVATALLLEQTEPLRIANAGWLLMNVVERSDTTEMPPALDNQWMAVMALLDVTESQEARKDAGFVKEELVRWYRRWR